MVFGQVSNLGKCRARVSVSLRSHVCVPRASAGLQNCKIGQSDAQL
jgi:hypothetical protein